MYSTLWLKASLKLSAKERENDSKNKLRPNDSSKTSKCNSTNNKTNPSPSNALRGIASTGTAGPHQFYIPGEDGLVQPAWWVKKVGDGQVAGLPRYHTTDTEPFIGNVYAQPDNWDVDDGTPVLPLGCWLLQILHGPSANFHQLERLIGVEDWGVQADVYHYCVLHHQLQDAEAHMAQLAAEIRTVRGAQELAKGRLESARLEKKVSQLRVLPARGRRAIHYQPARRRPNTFNKAVEA